MQCNARNVRLGGSAHQNLTNLTSRRQSRAHSGSTLPRSRECSCMLYRVGNFHRRKWTRGVIDPSEWPRSDRERPNRFRPQYPSLIHRWVRRKKTASFLVLARRLLAITIRYRGRGAEFSNVAVSCNFHTVLYCVSKH